MGAIQQAMQRRGMGMPTGALQQQSALSRTPGVQPGPTPPRPTGGVTGLGAGGAPRAGAAPATTEAEMIIKALSDRLKTHSKVMEARTIPPKPPAPARPPAAPTGGPAGISPRLPV